MKRSHHRSQEEMKQKLEDRLEEMKATVEETNVKLETKLKEFQQVVEDVNRRNHNTPSKVKVPTYDVLRGTALEMLRTIPEASPNYATLTSALERRYADAHLQHYTRHN
ncbi:hypothetical protein NQ315_005040 [Exocentrus adspersus]|uniref:Uncharacterized protein n=1 Tax=Exocentrus adspersus TaxID=1586481 RepID=A0AAV8VQL1_9CUCU|nr:hypothetical protein NQ315_005040 [Exocentrus adspersus]